MIPLHLADEQSHPHPLLHDMVLLLLLIHIQISWLQHLPILLLPLHIFLNMHPRLILLLLLLPLCLHVCHHILLILHPLLRLCHHPPIILILLVHMCRHPLIPLPPPLPPHVSQDFYSLDTMITSSTIALHIHDIDI
jgi:hypothetical protein